MTTEVQKRELFPKYAKLVCNPQLWLDAAQRLYATAELLEPEINRLWKEIRDSIFSTGQTRIFGPFMAYDYQAVYLMLVAYSLENLMKGALARKMRSTFLPDVRKSGTLPQDLRTHNLVKLAEACDLTLLAEELDFLKRITRHVEWVGRYPIAATAERFYHLFDSNSVPSSGRGWSSSDIDEVRMLIKKISKQLQLNIRMSKRKPEQRLSPS